MKRTTFRYAVLVVAATVFMTGCGGGDGEVSDLPSYKSKDAVRAAIMSAGIPCAIGGMLGTNGCYFTEGDIDGQPSVYISFASDRSRCIFVEFANGYIYGNSRDMDVLIPWEDLAAATGGRLVENPDATDCPTN